MCCGASQGDWNGSRSDQIRRKRTQLRGRRLWHGYAFARPSDAEGVVHPRWSDKPLQKSWEKTKPVLGFPRETDSLCPTCVREAREAILDGSKDVSVLLNEKVGEIKATILERDGKILMVKDCPVHGHFEDVMSIDPACSGTSKRRFRGGTSRAHNDEKLHNHGSSTIKYGRGLRADDRPHQPLQHDVRPVLHGRQPGGVRPN